MKWILIAVGALVILGVAGVVALPYLLDLPRIQSYIAQGVSRAVGRPVTFSDLSVSVLPLPAVVLKDLQVAEDPRFGSDPFLSVGEGRFRLRLRPLLSRRVEFSELTLKRPRMALIQDSNGRWNMASLGRSSPGPAGPSGGDGGAGGGKALVAVVSRLRIVDGSLDYQARGRPGPGTRYRVDNMMLTFEGLGTPASASVQGTARINPGTVLVRLVGTVGPPPSGDPFTAAPVAADIALEARAMSELASALLGPAPSVSGSVKGTLTLSGTLAGPRLAGELEATRLTLTDRRPGCPPPETRQLTLESVRVPLAFDPVRLLSRPVSARLLEGTITATLTFAWDPTEMLSLKAMTIKALPLEPVLVDYLCQGYAVTGPLDLMGELSARPRRLLSTLNGRGEVRIGAGKVVGSAALGLFASVARVGGALSSVLKVDLPHSLFSSPVDFESITASYRVVDGRVSTKDLLSKGEGMTVAGAGEYGLADGRLDFDLTLVHGRSRIKARVTGTAASPSVRVLPGSILRVEPGKVPSGLQQFLERLTK